MSPTDLEPLLDVVALALGIPRAALSRDASSRSLAAWDSLGHVQVVLAVEERYGVRFTTQEIPGLDSIEALARRLGLEQRP